MPLRGVAPDLGKRFDRDFTPAAMASLMWNHGPQMWSAMRKTGIEKETLSPESQMWNHGARMRQAYADRKLCWSPITAQQLKDILVYLEGLPENRELVTAFAFPPSATGAQLFRSKGCADCHTGKLALETLLGNQSLSEVAVDMWNHQTAMKQPALRFSQEEMPQLLGYIWMRPYFRGAGDPPRGRKVFMAKNSAACHGTGANGAPKLGKTPEGYSHVTMMSTPWDHGPRMLEVMNERKLPWPSFTAPEMTDLIAYLNAL